MACTKCTIVRRQGTSVYSAAGSQHGPLTRASQMMNVRDSKRPVWRKGEESPLEALHCRARTGAKAYVICVASPRGNPSQFRWIPSLGCNADVSKTDISHPWRWRTSVGSVANRAHLAPVGANGDAVTVQLLRSRTCVRATPRSCALGAPTRGPMRAGCASPTIFLSSIRAAGRSIQPVSDCVDAGSRRLHLGRHRKWAFPARQQRLQALRQCRRVRRYVCT